MTRESMAIITFISRLFAWIAGWHLVYRMLRKHVHLNYSFTLNQRQHVDSARVGNETRYINHGSEKEDKANSMARSARLLNKFLVHSYWFSDLATLVHGEHRIALYASKLIRSCLGRHYERLTRIRPLTARYIRAGEEILFDYGEAYWGTDPGS